MGLWPYGITAEKRLGKRPNVRKPGIREFIVMFGTFPNFIFRNKISIHRMIFGSQDRATASLDQEQCPEVEPDHVTFERVKSRSISPCLPPSCANVSILGTGAGVIRNSKRLCA